MPPPIWKTQTCQQPSPPPPPSKYAPSKSSNRCALLPRAPLKAKSHNLVMQASQTCPAPVLNPSTRAMPYTSSKSTVGMANPSTTFRTNKGQAVTPRLAQSPAPRNSPIFAKDPPWEAYHTPKRDLRDELNSNITPRSGSRRARVGSVSSTTSGTPNRTPGNSRPASIVGTSNWGAEGAREINGLGLRRVGVARTARSGSVVSNGKSSILSSEVSPERDLGYGQASSPDISPMFFHANDAKSSLPLKNSIQPALLSGKTASLAHANGERKLETDTSSSSAVSPPEMPQPKFFQVNTASKYASTSCKPNVHVSSLASPNQGTFPLQNRANIQRPTSPLKDVEVSRKSSVKKASPRQHLSLSTNGGLHQLELPGVPSSNSSSLGRRSSLRASGNPLPRHVKTSSVSSIDSLSSQRKSIPVLVDKRSERRVSIATESESLVEEPQSLTPKTPPLPSSPAKSSLNENKLDHLNELAANARRERKVLDLEISNSSLLAINRTLERELHKQNAELRRYRRLTQAGRLSIAPSKRSLSSHLPSVLPTGFPTDTSDPSDNDDDTLDLDLSEDDTESPPHTPLSPSAQISHDARLRAKDEKRLQLDLSIHQALLIDSQKLNQSIKRCLAWTEELISDAKKALDYRVQVSDIGVDGGRVLSPDDLVESEDDTPQQRGLLSLSPPGHERMSATLLRSSGSYRRSLIGLDDEGSGSAGTGVPTPEGKDGSGNGNGSFGFGDYLNSLGESWGL